MQPQISYKYESQTRQEGHNLVLQFEESLSYEVDLPRIFCEVLAYLHLIDKVGTKRPNCERRMLMVVMMIDLWMMIHKNVRV